MRPALRRLIEATSGGDREDAAMRVALMPNEWLFDISSVGGGSMVAAKP